MGTSDTGEFYTDGTRKPRWPLTLRETVLLCVGLATLAGSYFAPVVTLAFGFMAIGGAVLLALAARIAL